MSLLATAVPLATAKPQTAVTLIYFQGSEEQDGVHLSWGTGSEINTVAFYLRRSDGTTFIDLTELYDENGNLYPGGIIDSVGDPALGSDYLAIDPNVVTGIPYTYQLMEVEDNNSVNLLSTIIVTTGATATPTLQTISTSPTPMAAATQNSGNNTPTSTITATSSSNSASPTATTTPLAANTLASTANRATATAVNNDNSLASITNEQVPEGNFQETQTNELQLQPTSSPYPGLTPPTTTEPEDESYPEQPPVLAPADTPTPYPLVTQPAIESPTPTIISVIGDDTAEPDGENGSTNSNEQVQSSASSLSVLWGGFILAIIVFVAAVIGSIMIFVRKRN